MGSTRRGHGADHLELWRLLTGGDCSVSSPDQDDQVKYSGLVSRRCEELSFGQSQDLCFDGITEYISCHTLDDLACLQNMLQMLLLSVSLKKSGRVTLILTSNCRIQALAALSSCIPAF